MRLDLGPDGKIIGTRRVSPNGQISGLSEYTGREVLVILPGTAEPGFAPAWPGSEEFTRLVGEQIRQAYERTRILQETYATPWEATRSFMKTVFGAQAPDLMDEVDRWVKSQVREASAAGSPDPSKTSDDPSEVRRNRSGTPRSAGSTKKRP
ncbi:MAG: hypothetical protein WB778_04090 [Thermoplasmata archaeon]|jgi:hypothetical protein